MNKFSFDLDGKSNLVSGNQETDFFKGLPSRIEANAIGVAEISFEGSIKIIGLLDNRVLPEPLQKYGAGRIEGELKKILVSIPKDFPHNAYYTALHELYDIEEKGDMKKSEQRVVSSFVEKNEEVGKVEMIKFIEMRLGFFRGNLELLDGLNDEKDHVLKIRETITYLEGLISTFRS